MKRIQKGCAAALVAMIGAGAVQAQPPIAHLTKITGTVLIGWNGEYQQVAPGSAPALSPGNNVITLEDSGAEVVYEDACSVMIPENSLLLLSTADECSRGLALVQSAPSRDISAFGTAAPPAAATEAGDASALGTLGAMAGFIGFGVLVHKTGDDAAVPPPPPMSPE